MKNTNAGAIRATALTALVASLCGCTMSDRKINLGNQEIATQDPISLGRDASPVGASRDGRYIALLCGLSGNSYKLSVLDTQDLKTVATIGVGGAGARGTIFSLDGKRLDYADPMGYLAWSFETGNKTKLAGAVPDIDADSAILSDTGWNYDRTVAISYPNPGVVAGRNNLAKAINKPGTVLVAGGRTFTVDPQAVGGFDEYGNAWVGRGHSWIKIDRTGHSAMAGSHPRRLVHDQTKDRGSRHLRATRQVMRYKGAKAYVSCVWLTDDRAVPYVVKGQTTRRRDSYQAALVMAVADLADFGFVPGKDMAYVITQSGSYLVPFKVAKGIRP